MANENICALFYNPLGRDGPEILFIPRKNFLIFLLTFPLCQGVSYPQEPVPKTK